MTEIDLLEIGGVLLHWAWLIVAVALVFGAVAFCFSKFMLPEQFQSTTKVYVLNQSYENGKDAPTVSDLQVGSQLTKDYAEMITSRYVLEKVIADLNLPYEYETLKGKVTVSSQPDTRILQISVIDEDPYMAQMITRNLRINASAHIKNVMDVNAINIVDDANLPNKKCAPNNAKNALIAAVIGALLSSGLVVVRYMMDDTVKTAEDVEKYLGLSCLALIPLDESISKGGSAKTRKKPSKPRLRFGLKR